jgi:hypothetical protein
MSYQSGNSVYDNATFNFTKVNNSVVYETANI